MFDSATKLKHRVITTKPIPFVKNQNFIKQIKCRTKYDSEFHNCMRNVMRLCRWVGLFPVEGLERTSSDNLKFNLQSFYGVFYFVTIFGQILNVIILLIKVIQAGATLSALTSMMFYVNGIVSRFLLLVTARNWFSLVKKATALEEASGIRINKRTSNKIIVLTYTINVFGLFEHCLAVNYHLKFIRGCKPNCSFSEVVKEFLFQRMPFNISLGKTMQLISQIYLEVTDSQESFMWSFTDVVNISMSMYLIAHFKILNQQIYAGCDNKSTNWMKLRDQQRYLVQLVQLINDHFSYFILLSYFCNLYFMCVQLYNTFGKVVMDMDDCDYKGINDFQQSLDHHAYFFFSFVYLMFKILTLTYLAANVYGVAREPLTYLGDIHPSIYGNEIERFYRQINYTTIGVSGAFFYITRGTILKVISSLITYEIMLIQINNNKHTSHLSALYNASSIYEQ